MLMVIAAAVAALPDYAQPAGLKALAPLAGCWTAPGEVRGRDATSVMRGEWHLGGRYFVLHVRAVTEQPYEAAISYGAGEKPGQIGSFWMDTFGGMYEPSLGLGKATESGFTLAYKFPEALYVNRFERSGERWRWTITEEAAGKPDKAFASYELTPASCKGMTFAF
jgi:hypothetical protein